jgi:hypothetical protein
MVIKYGIPWLESLATIEKAKVFLSDERIVAYVAPIARKDLTPRDLMP